MVHSLRQVKSVSSHNHGRETLAPNATVVPGTGTFSQLPKLPQQRSILDYAKARETLAVGPPTPRTTSIDLDRPHDCAGHGSSIETGRPPLRILDSGNGALQEHVNGVVANVELCVDNVTALSTISATTFDREITKDIAPVEKSREKRILRSQDNSSRPKSNLARFFPDFDDVVFGENAKPELLSSTSVLFLFDKKHKGPDDGIADRTHSPINGHANANDVGGVLSYDKSKAGSAEDRDIMAVSAAIMNFTPYEEVAKGYVTDPLTDSAFIQAHKRGERREKQIRNIEKEHALHEKLDLEKLLEELHGSEWLRTMGVFGVADIDKKKYEPFRDQYIQRARALLHKFTQWKEQERDLKLRREEALLARGGADVDEEEDGAVSTHGQGPDLVDASARQLQFEAKSASHRSPIKLRLYTKTYMPIPEPEPLKPFVSFYANLESRAEALGEVRLERSVTAFGQRIPDVDQREFVLPEGYVTEEMVIANARKRRRLKRESAADSSILKR